MSVPEEAMLYSLFRETGALPNNHVLVDIMRSSMLQAVGVNVSGEDFSSWETLQKALLHHGGQRILNLLVGPGHHGEGAHWGTNQFTPSQWFGVFNMPGSRARSLRADVRATLTQGAVLRDVLRCDAVHEGIGALAIKRPLSRVTLLTLATDAVCMAPGLQHSVRTLQLVGAKCGPLDLKSLNAMAPTAELELNSSMMEFTLSTLSTREGSRQFDMPVGMWACTSGGGLAVAKARHNEVFPLLMACTECIERAVKKGGNAELTCEPTCPWGKCDFERAIVCSTCGELGVTSTRPLERPCASCLRLVERGGLPRGKCVCRRRSAVFLASDCESRELSLMGQLDLSGFKGVLTRGVPDLVHLLKSLRSAMYWWWLCFGGHLVCLRLLMVLRASADPALHAALVKAVRAATLRNKDRMDFETVVELLSFAVMDALPIEAPVVVTLFPEKWTRLTRDCPDVSINTVADTCVHEPGNVVFVSDAGRRAVVAIQLHCPVITTLVVGGGDAVAGAPGFGKGAGFAAPAGLVVRELRLGGGKGRGRAEQWSTFLFVVDTGLGSVVVVDVGPVLHQQSRVLDGDADVAGFGEQASPPGAAADATPSRNRLSYASLMELDFTEGAMMNNPFAVCDANPPASHAGEKAKVKLYVTDVSKDAPTILCIDAKNTKYDSRTERASFAGTVDRVVALPSTWQPRSIAFQHASNRLLVADAASTQIMVIDPTAKRILQSVAVGEASPSDAVSATGVWGLALRGDGLQLLATVWPNNLVFVELSVDEASNELSFGLPQSLLAGDASNLGAQHDDLAELATTSHPRGPAYHGKSVIFADAANGIRLLTNVGPLRDLLQMFAPLAASIGFLPGCKTLSWGDGEATLEAIVAQVCVWEVEALQRTGKKKPGAMQGPQGMISGSVRKALKLLLSSVRDVRVWLKAEYNVDLHAEGVTFDRLLTLCVEIFFSKIRCGPTGSSATLMELQYRERRAALVESLLRERFSATGVNLFTSSTSYYPEPPAQVGLQRSKPHSIYPARLATSTQHPHTLHRPAESACGGGAAGRRQPLRRAGTKAREGPLIRREGS